MIAAALLIAIQASAPIAADIRGEWTNPRGSVTIRISDCSSGLCGTVIWSTAAAQRDAARGGTTELNGTVVLMGFIPASAKRWRGKLVLPDQDRVVNATIEWSENDELQVKGCDLGGLVCRSQTWNRRSQPRQP